MDDTATMRDAQKRVGSVLCQKWRLDALLGVGGMAAVYAATHRNGKRVAVKVLHAFLCGSDEARARFLREGYAANAIRHPGVVSVHDDDKTADGAVFLVMDLLDGETLDARWARKGRRLPVEEVLATTSEVLGVLAAAHAAAIVHRDIKPENVFLTTAGEVRVLDFGIARVRELSAGAGVTQTGAAMGTPSFMPPEQARGRWDDVDARSDVWSLGAMMFTLLAGRYVHEAETVNEALLSAMTQPAPRLASVWPQVPEAVARVVDRALAFERNARFQDARSMHAAVEEVRRALNVAGPPRRPLTSLADAAEHAPVPPSAHVSAARPTGFGAATSVPGATVQAPADRRRTLAIALASSAAAVVVLVTLLARFAAPHPARASDETSSHAPSSGFAVERALVQPPNERATAPAAPSDVAADAAPPSASSVPELPVSALPLAPPTATFAPAATFAPPTTFASPTAFAPPATRAAPRPTPNPLDRRH
jgi:serine/threonine-protein kinase